MNNGSSYQWDLPPTEVFPMVDKKAVIYAAYSNCCAFLDWPDGNYFYISTARPAMATAPSYV